MIHPKCAFCKKAIFSMPIKIHANNKWTWKYTMAHKLCLDKYNDRSKKK